MPNPAATTTEVDIPKVTTGVMESAENGYDDSNFKKDEASERRSDFDNIITYIGSNTRVIKITRELNKSYYIIFELMETSY